MSVRIMSAVWETSKAKDTELLLLLAIADHANDEGYAYPKVATLARKIRMTERSVRRLTGQLVELGELEVTFSDSGRGPNLYRVLIGGTELSALLMGEDHAVRSGGTELSARGDKAVPPTLMNLDQPSLEPSGAPPRTKLVTKAFLSKMAEEFPNIDVAEEWDRARNHTAYLKAIDKQRYFRNWLNRSGKGNYQRGQSQRKSSTDSVAEWKRLYPNALVTRGD